MNKNVLGSIGLLVGFLQIIFAGMLIFIRLPRVSEVTMLAAEKEEFKAAVQIAHFGAVLILVLGIALVYFSWKEFSKKKKEAEKASRYVIVLLTGGVLISTLLLALSSRALIQ